MNELALFAGAGGGILGGKILGWRTRCAVEIDPYARKVLLARQREGMLEPFPIWDDVKTFDGIPWNGSIDIISGGFPCQDISTAGKGAGLAGEKSSMWFEMLRVVREVRPQFVFVENVPMLRFRGFGTVLGGLAESGYDAAWRVLGARQFGFTHLRERIWILASNSIEARCSKLENKKSKQKIQMPNYSQMGIENRQIAPWRQDQPPILRMDDGMAPELGVFETCGNGQIPAVAAIAFQHLRSILESEEG